MGVVLALDAGTTGVRTRAVFDDGRDSIASYREFPQYFPQPGWVEHNAEEIWSALVETMVEVTQQISEPIAAIGITNQRETVVAWSQRTGRPFGHAIVWQDRRTAPRCEELLPHLDLVRRTTGLVLDPYFSGTKAAWLLKHYDTGPIDDVRIGTIDTWIVWKLTAGESFVTDASNASRTMLFDITTMRWSHEMCELLDVPMSTLGEVRPTSSRLGLTRDVSGVPDGIPSSSVVGDQQAALFGQMCTQVGMAKNTYGTGSFVLMNVGSTCPTPTEGMLTTIAWDLGSGAPTYALEGSIFVTGAAVQWLRDGLGIISKSSDIGPLAATVPDSGGVYFVPAFGGLLAPHWEEDARGTLLGMTGG